MKKSIGDHSCDCLSRFAFSPLPVSLERLDRTVESRPPPIIAFAQSFEKSAAFPQTGSMRIENPNNAEKLAESRSPFVDMIPGAGPVDQSDPRLPGSTQNLHFGFIISPIRMRAIDNIKNRTSIKNRPKQSALLHKLFASFEMIHKLLDHFAQICRAPLPFLQKPKCPRRILETGSINHLKKSLPIDRERKPMNLPRGPRPR